MKIYLSCLFFTLASLTDVASVPLEPTPSDPVNGGNVTSTAPNSSNATISSSPVVANSNSSEPHVNTTTSPVPAALTFTPYTPVASGQVGDLSNVLSSLIPALSAISAIPGLGDLLNFIWNILNSVLWAISGLPLVNALLSIISSIPVLRSMLTNLLVFPGLSLGTSGGSTGSQSLPTGFSGFGSTENNGLTTLLNSVFILLAGALSATTT